MRPRCVSWPALTSFTKPPPVRGPTKRDRRLRSPLIPQARRLAGFAHLDI